MQGYSNIRAELEQKRFNRWFMIILTSALLGSMLGHIIAYFTILK